MGRSTGISAALHTAILFFALVAFPPAKMDKAPLIAIPVDLATPSEITKVKAGSAGATDGAAEGREEARGEKARCKTGEVQGGRRCEKAGRKEARFRYRSYRRAA